MSPRLLTSDNTSVSFTRRVAPLVTMGRWSTLPTDEDATPVPQKKVLQRLQMIHPLSLQLYLTQDFPSRVRGEGIKKILKQ
jgi:hypothetical protein